MKILLIILLLIPAACTAQFDGWKADNMKYNMILRSADDLDIQVEYDPANCKINYVGPDSTRVIKFMFEFIMQQGQDNRDQRKEIYDKDEIIALLERSYPEVTFVERKKLIAYVGAMVKQIDRERGIYVYKPAGWFCLYKFKKQ